ncbi:SDR family NAD(P)-dependent oxidoreductase [Amycolatopsis rhabdoformis]|uniref:SDR family NAD(P)-dependent oxidoreductase n=1 Tax=Amycolatopsis rhabdoformis TaxID=1448059 RepID=A0ABZ1IC84_9PSEU|nr:SDR family NAD(P)-dependent oxidoreductase [Amycolatopsis rhabdoformis]WSE32086.1 SDR family NAD(P)-dependent oxidoreductase [Amycolatopsis rhabdoformis]
MDFATTIDTALDRGIVLGYGSVGLRVRRRLPGWPADPPPMPGKTVLVTGAGSGLGLAAATGFARLGAQVHVLGRNAERAGEAARRTLERAPGADVRPQACDVSDLAQLRAFAEKFAGEEPRLDVLVNNAGVMPGRRTHTADGLELTFATQVVAPWVLTAGLEPVLARSAPSRVINVVSGGLYGQRIPAGDLQSADTRYGPKKVYARTKREELVLTQQWAERLLDRGVHVHAMHPGWADTEGVRTGMPVFRALTRPVIRTPDEGADTIVWLGSAPEAVESSGLFWHDRRPRPATHPLGAGPDDEPARKRLWDYVEGIATPHLNRQ